MLYPTKHLTAAVTAASLCAPAFAGLSLDNLTGDPAQTPSKESVIQTDSAFSHGLTKVAPADVETIELDEALLFGTAIFNDPLTGILEFEAVEQILTAEPQLEVVPVGTDEPETTGAEGQGGEQVLLETADGGAAKATGGVRDDFPLDFGAPVETVVYPDINIESSPIVQQFNQAASIDEEALALLEDEGENADETTTPPAASPTAVPSPTAALAGAFLLGALGMRRRRNA